MPSPAACIIHDDQDWQRQYSCLESQKAQQKEDRVVTATVAAVHLKHLTQNNLPHMPLFAHNPYTHNLHTYIHFTQDRRLICIINLDYHSHAVYILTR